MAESAYTVLVKRVGGWWIGWVQEVPGVNAQERTKEELLVSLRQALHEAIEFNREGDIDSLRVSAGVHSIHFDQYHHRGTEAQRQHRRRRRRVSL